MHRRMAVRCCRIRRWFKLNSALFYNSSLRWQAKVGQPRWKSANPFRSTICRFFPIRNRYICRLWGRRREGIFNILWDSLDRYGTEYAYHIVFRSWISLDFKMRRHLDKNQLFKKADSFTYLRTSLRATLMVFLTIWTPLHTFFTPLIPSLFSIRFE